MVLCGPYITNLSTLLTMISNRSIWQWFVSHPEFLSNPFYVAGDSYAGMFIPVITQIISNGKSAFYSTKST